MPDLPLNGSRRKRLASAKASSSSQEGGVSILRMMFAVVFTVILATCLLAPKRVDSVLERILPASTGKRAESNQVWKSITSALTSEDVERGQMASPAALFPETVLQQNESIATGSAGRTVLTHGNDILEMEPETTIAVDDSGQESASTIIRLIKGTIHLTAGKRTGGQTFSVETQYLVATVKGTKFDVTTLDGGTAVSVTEGIVSVRSAGAGDGVDVTPGNTAVVAAADGAAPVTGPTPAGGASIAIEAAKAQSAGGGAGPGEGSGH